MRFPLGSHLSVMIFHSWGQSLCSFRTTLMALSLCTSVHLAHLVLIASGRTSATEKRFLLQELLKYSNVEAIWFFYTLAGWFLQTKFAFHQGEFRFQCIHSELEIKPIVRISTFKELWGPIKNITVLKSIIGQIFDCTPLSFALFHSYIIITTLNILNHFDALLFSVNMLIEKNK